MVEDSRAIKKYYQCSQGIRGCAAKIEQHQDTGKTYQAAGNNIWRQASQGRREKRIRQDNNQNRDNNARGKHKVE
jgi:nuclear transport factor 2 (NTF2) superfamily protein